MSSKETRVTTAPTLEDRIKRIRTEVDVIIDAKVAAVAKENPGVPPGVIRNLLTARAPACACSQYLDLEGQR
jgi:hypothetical protein